MAEKIKKHEFSEEQLEKVAGGVERDWLDEHWQPCPSPQPAPSPQSPATDQLNPSGPGPNIPPDPSADPLSSSFNTFER